MEAIRFQTKFCIVSPSRILHPAQLVVRHGRVAEVTEGCPYQPDFDLGDTVLMPGLVNAHTHLEFSRLEQPFRAGETFPDWIAQVVRYRAEQQALIAGNDRTGNDNSLQRTLRVGMQEAFLSGTAMIADIVSSPWMPSDYPTVEQYHASPLREEAESFTHGFYPRVHARALGPTWFEHLQPVTHPRILPLTEWIGLSAERCIDSCQWSQTARAATASDLQIGSGVSPHAPYSLHFPTVIAALEQVPRNTTVAMHVAESREELRWIEGGEGPFGEAFARLGLRVEATPPSIDQCVEMLAGRRRALLIHGNYLTQPQIERIASSPGLAVVYCPRTHLHFGHAAYPLTALQSAGVPLLLGTDSRASNPSLCLWDEVMVAAQKHPQVAPSDWLKSVTLGPALALGVAEDFGSLEVGRLAFATAMPARTHWTSGNLLEALCASDTAELSMRPLIIG